jgi:hypothetical protein
MFIHPKISIKRQLYTTLHFLIELFLNFVVCVDYLSFIFSFNSFAVRFFSYPAFLSTLSNVTHSSQFRFSIIRLCKAERTPHRKTSLRPYLSNLRPYVIKCCHYTPEGALIFYLFAFLFTYLFIDKNIFNIFRFIIDQI